MDEPSSEEINSNRIVQRAAIFSTLWLFVSVVLILGLKRADVPSMKPSDWGDFLAGVSAPLAFGWLVVAVFIQRNELRAQIKELNASRKALEAQIEEQKITAQALTAQHELMKAEWMSKQNKSIIENSLSSKFLIIEGFTKSFEPFEVVGYYDNNAEAATEYMIRNIIDSKGSHIESIISFLMQSELQVGRFNEFLNRNDIRYFVSIKDFSSLIDKYIKFLNSMKELDIITEYARLNMYIDRLIEEVNTTKKIVSQKITQNKLIFRK